MNRASKRFLLTLAAIFVLVVPLIVYAGCKTSRAGYESADYTTTTRDGPFEIREYPELALVSAPMKNSDRDGMNSGFNQLFRYITGNNQSDTKIAMTTPVFIERSTQNPSMSFVLPGDIKAPDAPEPNNAAVAVTTKKAGTFATCRFAGSRNSKTEQDATDKLKTWIAHQGLTTIGEPEFAYYDPPWTPTFLRRNEVLMRLATPLR
ncbi:MAG: heme-binding protein [Verrucomicrobiota bacterium]